MIALLAVVGGLGYFSFSTIKYGTIPKKEDTVTQTPVTDPEPITDGSLAPVTPDGTGSTTTQPVTTPAPATSSANAPMIAALQKMLDAKTVLNSGKANGADVKTVQEFLNIYDKKNVAANSNYGPGTTTRVKEFQKAQGVSVTGNTGPQTLQKMIDWLKTQ